MNVEIRHERDEDFQDLIDIHRDAFQRSDEGELVEKLHQNSQYDRQYSLVALIDGKLVGHLLFTPLKIRYSSTSNIVSSFALAPLSIRTDFQCKRIGTRLMEFALNELRSKNVRSIVVLGHENFYPKFGFIPARYFHIRGPFQLKNDDCLMVLEMQPGVLPLDQGTGVLEYLFEFLSMPGTKRLTKNDDDDDDDDFIPIVDQKKKNRSELIKVAENVVTIVQEEKEIISLPSERLPETPVSSTRRTSVSTEPKERVMSSEPSKRRASLPFGFPTSKINLPAHPASRVGLSRKSAIMKPLHPNVNPRVDQN